MSSPKVSFPKTNYTKELQQTLKGQQETAPGYFALNSQYAPQYTGLNLRTLSQTLFGSPGTPGEVELLGNALSTTRGRDIQDIWRYGPEGYRALMLSNPGLAEAIARANSRAGQSYGPDSLLAEMEKTAKEQLALGGGLSPQEETAITQGSRAGYSDRGMMMGNQSLGAELLARDQYMNQRLAQRLGYGAQVMGSLDQAQGELNNLASINASIYDPSQQVLGRGSSSISSLLGGGGVSPLSLMGTMDTSRLFQPGAGADAYNTNLNAQAAAGIANANSGSALTGSLIGAGGAIIGGGLLAL